MTNTHHVIIGAGNLGMDLARELRKRGHGVEVLTRSTGFDVRQVADLVRVANRADVSTIWYCVGYGTVDAAKANPDLAEYFHFTVPTILARFAAKRVRLVVFSADDAADEALPHRTRHNPCPRSHYAALKVRMERTLLWFDRPLTTIVRIGSLYGTTKPELCFPHKIIKAFACTNVRIQLPANMVTPTPTLWLAWLLAEEGDGLWRDNRTKIDHAAPAGNVSVKDWAIMVLHGVVSKATFEKAVFFDDERPYFSALSSTLGADTWHWHDLWRFYFKPKAFTPPVLRHALGHTEQPRIDDKPAS